MGSNMKQNLNRVDLVMSAITFAEGNCPAEARRCLVAGNDSSFDRGGHRAGFSENASAKAAGR
jgi:hypothetical protein